VNFSIEVWFRARPEQTLGETQVFIPGLWAPKPWLNLAFVALPDESSLSLKTLIQHWLAARENFPKPNFFLSRAA
jgi:hypothetical protein